jgi:hypothetical protein
MAVKVCSRPVPKANPCHYAVTVLCTRHDGVCSEVGPYLDDLVDASIPTLYMPGLQIISFLFIHLLTPCDFVRTRIAQSV